MSFFANFKALGAVLGLFALFGCKEQQSSQTSQNSQKSKIVVVTSADNPPFSYHRFGRITGFEIALVKKIAKDLGAEVEIKDLSFETLVAALQSKTADLAIASLEPTAERQKVVTFSVPYHHSLSVVVFSKNAPLQKVEELTKQTIGVQAGSTYESYAQKEIQPKVDQSKIHSLTKIPELILALKNKQIQALITGIIEVDSLIKNHPDLDYFKVAGSETTYAIAFPKDSPWIEKFNTVLEKFKKDGTLEKLVKEFLK
jgi:ABC-type amino acid transport substrate-binding protein